MPFTAGEIAARIGGEVTGDATLLLKGFAPADRAQTGDLTFAENENYFARAEQSSASAVIVDGRFVSSRKVLIRVPNARIAFAKVLPLFFPEPVFPGGIHPTAIVPACAVVDSSAYIGPYCVLTRAALSTGERAKSNFLSICSLRELPIAGQNGVALDRIYGLEAD